MPGSGVHNILEWRRRDTANETPSDTSPLDIASELEKRSDNASSVVSALRAGMSSPHAELDATFKDIEAMAHLARYYGAKIRGAAALARYDRSSDLADQDVAVAHLERAVGHWRDYAASYSAQYTSPHLYNRVGFVDIPGLVLKAQDDVFIAREWKPGTIPGDTPPRDPGARIVPDVGGNKHRVLLS